MLGLAGELLELRGRLICHGLSVTAALFKLEPTESWGDMNAQPVRCYRYLPSYIFA